MRPYVLLYLYRNRLRVHTAQELLAGLGVAVAVALVFATLVANGSIAGSAGEVVRAAAGSATLQLEARGPDGVPGQLLEAVEALPGVKRAAPLLEHDGRPRHARRPVAHAPALHARARRHRSQLNDRAGDRPGRRQALADLRSV